MAGSVLLQAARDALAQLGHLDALFARGVVGRGRRAHRGGNRCGAEAPKPSRRRRTCRLCLRVHPCRSPRPRGIDTRFGGDAVHGRSVSACRAGPLSQAAGAGGAAGAGAAAGAGGPRQAAAAAPEPAETSEQCADADRLAVLDGRFWTAPEVGVDFEGDLVGLQLDEEAHSAGVAGLLEPLADGGLGDGFAEARYVMSVAMVGWSSGLIPAGEWRRPGIVDRCAEGGTGPADVSPGMKTDQAAKVPLQEGVELRQMLAGTRPVAVRAERPA